MEDFGNTKRVEGDEEKPFEGKEDLPREKKKKKKRELTPEELGLQKEYQTMLDQNKRLFQTFAKDVSLDFKMSDGFYIDLENGVVNSDAKWYADKECSREQVLWAHLHELTHFRDLAEDPEAMMANFEYIREQAKKTGEKMMEKWEQKYGVNDPEFMEKLKKQRPMSRKDPTKTMNAVEGAAYQFHHAFFNVFDDIWVNNSVARRAPAFESGAKGGDETERLYREKLFKETDFAKVPRHMQFLYKLLREEMVPDEEATVGGDVTEALAKKIKFYGKEYAPKEIVENFIKPKSGRDTKAGERYFALKKLLEPVFEELLAKDLDEWDPKKPEKKDGQNGEGDGGEGEGDSGEANPFSDDYNEFSKNSPDQISEDDMKEWSEKREENKKEKETQKKKEDEDAKKTPEEKAKDAENKADEAWCEKNQITPETFSEFRRIEREIAPYLDDLSRMWQRIVYGSSRRMEREMDGHYREGELDVAKVIEEWPKIESGDFEGVRAMTKMTAKEALVKYPELIRVRLAGDMSGSMDGEKIHILQQCAVLILSSLREFNTYLNLTRGQTKTKLRADTEAWVFGSDAERVKKFRESPGKGEEEEMVEIVKAFEHLKTTRGMTHDEKPLKEIFKSLSSEEKEKILKSQVMEIVFEVTDGGSSNPTDARKAVNDLLGAKVIARAIQIGQVSSEETDLFNEVWNDNREEKFGEAVGEDIANLLPVVTELLKKYLGNVRL